MPKNKAKFLDPFNPWAAVIQQNMEGDSPEKDKKKEASGGVSEEASTTPITDDTELTGSDESIVAIPLEETSPTPSDLPSESKVSEFAAEENTTEAISSTDEISAPSEPDTSSNTQTDLVAQTEGEIEPLKASEPAKGLSLENSEKDKRGRQKKERKVKTGYSFSASLLERLKRLAERDGVSLTEIMERAFTEFCDHADNNPQTTSGEAEELKKVIDSLPEYILRILGSTPFGLNSRNLMRAVGIKNLRGKWRLFKDVLCQLGSEGKVYCSLNDNVFHLMDKDKFDQEVLNAVISLGGSDVDKLVTALYSNKTIIKDSCDRWVGEGKFVSENSYYYSPVS